MDATTVGIDLAKNVFEIALADERGHIVERQRLTRARFDRFFANRATCRIVMEACGSAHHHARRLSSQGHDVVLLPAQYARAYVRRNKTDAADAAALIEAARCPDIRPVPIKSVDQQALQQLHRLRSQWMAARTARINFLRGCLREFGVGIPVGAQRAIQSVRDALSDPHGPVPMLHLGARASGAPWPQQSHRRPRQQTRAHRLGYLAIRARLQQQTLITSQAALSSLHA